MKNIKECNTSRGMDEEEARQALYERQHTFSKARCIERYGEKNGIEVWLDRQKKWLKKLNENSQNFDIEITDEIISKVKDEAGFRQYSNRVNYLSNLTYKENIYEIDPERLRETKAFELDHKVSRFEGFLKGIDEEIISCKHNLQVLNKSENLQKPNSKRIDLETLLELYNSDCKN